MEAYVKYRTYVEELRKISIDKCSDRINDLESQYEGKVPKNPIMLRAAHRLMAELKPCESMNEQQHEDEEKEKARVRVLMQEFRAYMRVGTLQGHIDYLREVGYRNLDASRQKYLDKAIFVLMEKIDERREDEAHRGA